MHDCKSSILFLSALSSRHRVPLAMAAAVAVAMPATTVAPAAAPEAVRRSSAEVGAHARKLILANGTDRLAIEYGGFLSNHLACGCIALDGLGAPPSLLNSFVSSYSKRLHAPPPADWRPGQPAAQKRGKPCDLPPLGSRIGFDARRAFYSSELSRLGGDAKALVARHLPRLVDGIVRCLAEACSKCHLLPLFAGMLCEGCCIPVVAVGRSSVPRDDPPRPRCDGRHGRHDGRRPCVSTDFPSFDFGRLSGRSICLWL